MKRINLSNEAKRDAEVGYEMTSSKSKVIYVDSEGRNVENEKRLKSTLETDIDALAARFTDGLADALISGDPEVDMEMVGLKLEGLKKVYLTPGNKVAYGVNRTEHLYNLDGSEKLARPEKVELANVAVEGVPLKMSGKLFPKKEALRKFIFTRSYQIRHVNGLTFDFLYDMARRLQEADSMMIIGAGPKGMGPVILSTGGTPYRAFLEGRVDDSGYALILRLTNLEMKGIPETETKE